MSSKLLTFAKDPTSYIAPSWGELAKLAFEVAKKIIADKRKFDRLVTLSKGGWSMTCSLVDLLQIPLVASLGVKFYTGIDERLEKPTVYQDLPKDVKGQRVLLFDDVADTGRSLVFAKDYLARMKVKSVTTATLYYKPHSEYKPDYFAAETSAWILFPYDVRGTIRTLGAKWGKTSIAQTEMKRRFKQCGIDEEWIDYFLKLEVKT
ncbi:MAG: phosphoribosyltransferase [Candidatus Chisholmbacteria bacterium]|nr:phosphoribosyltransferase [Candidatus Chisholmbacteria bacterium]